MGNAIGIMIVVEDDVGTRHVMGSRDIERPSVDAAFGSDQDDPHCVPAVASPVRIDVNARCRTWHHITMSAGFSWPGGEWRAIEEASLRE